MSNNFGNQYESQFRRPKKSGFKESSSMKNLMQVLGIGGEIASGVRRNKSYRDSTQTSFLSALTEGFESNYSAESIANMRNKITEYKKNNLNRMSADVMDMFGITETKLKEHSENLNHYDTMIGNIDALPNQAYDLVGQLAQHGSLETQADKDAYAKANWGEKTRAEKEQELIGVYQSYGTNMRDFMGRHGERINRNNPYLAKKYLELENVLLSSVSALDDGRISPNEQKFLQQNLKTPNPLKIQQWNNRNLKEIEWMDGKNRDQIYKLGEQYKHFDTILRLGLYTLEGDEDLGTERETFKVGSEADIRNYYVRQGRTGQDLENKVAEAREYTKSLQAQKFFYLGEANRYNTAYKDKHEIDILEGLGITVPDYSVDLKDQIITGTETETEEETGIDFSQSDLIKADTSKGNYEKNIEDFPEGKSHLKKPLKQMTSHYNQIKEVIDKVEYGGEQYFNIIDASSGKLGVKDLWPDLSAENLQKENLMPTDIWKTQITRSYPGPFKKTDWDNIYKWHHSKGDDYVNSQRGADKFTVVNLRNKIFNTNEKLDPEAPIKGISYKELLEMKKVYDEDTEKYNKVKFEMSQLKDIGLEGTDAWKILRAKEKQYGEKWLGWNNLGGSYREGNMAKHYATGNFKTEHHLLSALEFYESLMKSVLDNQASAIQKVQDVATY